jgi:hypothetical protein
VKSAQEMAGRGTHTLFLGVWVLGIALSDPFGTSPQEDCQGRSRLRGNKDVRQNWQPEKVLGLLAE